MPWCRIIITIAAGRWGSSLRTRRAAIATRRATTWPVSIMTAIIPTILLTSVCFRRCSRILPSPPMMTSIASPLSSRPRLTISLFFFRQSFNPKRGCRQHQSPTIGLLRLWRYMQDILWTRPRCVPLPCWHERLTSLFFCHKAFFREEWGRGFIAFKLSAEKLLTS